MATIDIEANHLIVRLPWWERLLAFHGELRVPLARVCEVIAPATAHRRYKRLDWRLLRLPGSHIPGVLQAGSYYRIGDGWEFYAIRDPHRSIVIELEGGSRFKRLIIQPSDETADAAKRRIDAARELPP